MEKHKGKGDQPGQMIQCTVTKSRPFTLGSQLSLAIPKPKQSLWPITADANNTMIHQLELEAIA